MDNEFVVRPSACRHAEEALEKIKRGLLHQLACLNESKIYGSYSGSCLTTKAAEVLPEICERPDCPLATVVAYKHIPDVYISVKLLPVVYHIRVLYKAHYILPKSELAKFNSLCRRFKAFKLSYRYLLYDGSFHQGYEILPL